ncbi:MarR family winged helix-turn-helix transcriptional regulator [Novosphingobium marinum]|uniref:DNA-binding MarR family transcriptional regulator n=1 Tax=Novosphingobium marinum TaxID=1514948 RepID=A0A7Y9XWD1_9SPHN|nr:MarR family winged helix-turn-helix transcriptional regulator [Novosphingobium marinum]NYH95695.1 DNA-binding MarR family transcriptional regulator [Novosphingobium marinum]
MTKRSNSDAGAAGQGATEGGAGSAGNRGQAGRGWRDLIELDARLHEQKNIRILTPEARVLLHLRLSGPVPVTTAMQVAGTSYRGFYAVLERLKQAGLVATVKDEKDQRVRRLSLDPSVPIPPVDR